MLRTRLALIAVMLATLIAYSPALRHEFTWWDDPSTIHQNPRLNPPTLKHLGWIWTHPHMSLYVPVTSSAWWALARISYDNDAASPDGIRLNPAVFHAASIAAHALAAAAAFVLLRRLLDRDAAALAGAMLFALHPVQAEAVAWASGLKDVLAGLLALISLHQHVIAAAAGSPDAAGGPDATAAPSRRRVHVALSLLALAAAILAKPSAVAVPLVAAAIDLLVLERSWKATLRSVAPMAIVCLPAVIVTALVQPPAAQVHSPLLLRPLVALDAMGFYLIKLLAPIRLAVDYGRRPADLAGGGWMTMLWLAPLAGGALLAMTWPRCRWLAAAAAVSAAALLPVLGLVPFHFQFFSTVADHYLYLAMLGPGLAAGWAVTRWPRPAGAAAVVALALCAAGTAAQLRHWRDDQALFTHTLSVNPRSFAALNMLGAAELDAAERLASVQPPAAAAHASRAAELFAAAAQLNPEFIQAHENLGYVLVTRMQRPDAAIGPLRTALELRHRYRETRGGHDIVGLYTLLARTLEQSGDAAAATEVRRLLHDLTEDARAAAPHAGAS